MQTSQSELLESKTAAYRLTEELSASISDCAALRDTVERQYKEMSSLKVCLQTNFYPCTPYCVDEQDLSLPMPKCFSSAGTNVLDCAGGSTGT